MPYLPVVELDWEDHHTHGLVRMMEYGVEQVKAGKADGLEFCIWKNEREFIDAYMKKHHPTILYQNQWIELK
jgi:hypothetical protein